MNRFMSCAGNDQGWWRKAICLVALTLLPHVSFATTMPATGERWSKLADTVFQNLSTAQGLPSAYTTSLAEDGDGFIWVGTQSGLARWDGYRFHNYNADSPGPGSLPNAFIRALHKDGQGRIWVGTGSAGLARYVRETDQFVTYPVSPAAIGHVDIRAIVNDDADGVWVATAAGLDHVNPVTGVIRHVRHDSKDSGSLPSKDVITVMLDRSGILWVATTNGLVRRAANTVGNSGFVAVPWTFPDQKKPIVTAMFEARDGRIWLGTTNKGAFIFDPHKGTTETIRGSDPTGSPWISETVFSFVETSAGEMWISSYGEGIVAVNLESLQARRIRNDARIPTSLANDVVTSMLRDRSGLLWVGTERGVGRHDMEQTAVLSLFGQLNSTDRLSDPEAVSVLPQADGTVWVGLHQNGIDIIDPVTSTLTGLRVDPVKNTSDHPKFKPGFTTFSAIATTRDGVIFAGTRNGIYRADPVGRKLIRLDWLANVGVIAFLIDAQRLWIAAAGSLNVVDLNEGDRAKPVRAPGSERLTDQRITLVEPAPGGALWVGTENGLNLYNPASQKIEKILSDPGDPQSLSSARISSVLTDRQNRLWVSTYDGLNLMLGRDEKGAPRFRRFGTKEGLPNTLVNKVLEDADGNIWASTDDGLARIDGKTLTVRALRSADGVAIQAYWANIGAVTKEGELLFGGGGGLTVVRPERYKEWTYRPPVVVTEIRLGGNLVPVARFNSVSASAVRPLTVSPGANSFAVEFAALDYSAPERNRYAYQLEGYDPAWINTDPSRRLAAYTNLPPGDYKLRMRGSNRNGVWTEPELVMPIKVLPAWYQTWWMRLIETFGAAAAIYALVHARTVYLKQRQRELEKQIGLRTNELVEKNIELHDTQVDLLDKNTELFRLNALQEEHQSELTRFLAVASHDLRQPMHALNLYLGALTTFDLPEPARPVLGNVSKCAQIMDDMFLALLDLSRLDAQVVDPFIKPFPIASLLSKIDTEFAPQAKAKGLELRVASCSAWVHSDTTLVEQILRNLTANAVRYTKAGTILVGCRRRGTTLRLAVYDTGIGIAPDQQKSVFEEFSQVGNAGHDRTQGLGLGLAIVRRLSRLLATPVTLVSALGRGSMFAIDLPTISAADAISQQSSLKPASSTVATTRDAFAGKLIVVIDDEESILDAMRALLEQWGCSVVTAASGNEAIANLSTCITVPDALICDFALRFNENGLDVISALQNEFNHDIPALIITGTITKDRIQEMSSSGMPVLHKPVSAAGLQEALSALLNPAPR